MKIESSVFGAYVITASVVSRSDGMYYWEVKSRAEGAGYATPKGHYTMSCGIPESMSGTAPSCHEAEFRAAAAMVEIASQQRLCIAESEVRFASLEAATESAAAATARLAAL